MDIDENVIIVKNLVKSFKVYFDRGDSLKERLMLKRDKYERRCVLNGISFNVKRGEAVGLIGHNGCGKSTTLKLLTRIIYPDSGSIRINGRVSSLIELGAGFHKDMTGRENIYTNAAIFGLSKREINSRIDDIIRFSELEDYIDNPVRTYSSGMYMRLAFSVAINVNADVLLIDEILAVGDVNFQQKCFEKLKEIKRKGTTIVIVSHSLGQIEQICDRTIWIDDGKIREDGIPKFVHEKYLCLMENERKERIEKEREEIEQENSVSEQGGERIDVKEERNNREVIKDDVEQGKVINSENVIEHQGADLDEKNIQNSNVKEKLPDYCLDYAVRMGNKKIEFTNVKIIDDMGKPKYSFVTGDKMDIIMEYKSNVENLEGNVGIGIFREDGVYCFGTNIDIETNHLIRMEKKGVIQVHIDYLPLMYGRYTLDVAIHSKDSIEIYDDIRNVKDFQIFRYKRDDGLVRIETKWLSNNKEIK